MVLSRRVAGLCVALLTSAGFAVVVLGAAPAVSAVAFPAAGGAPAYSTNFEIDGNKPVGGGPSGGMDWNALFSIANPLSPIYSALPGPYTTPTGQSSTGILGATYTPDPDAGGTSICASGTDGTAFPGTNTIDTNPYATGTANVNNKGDSCTGAAAYEIVRVTGPGYDQNHTVLYQYWTRSFDATGDMSVFQVLSGPLPGRCDDQLIGFDYNSNVQNIASYTAYTWQAADCPGAGTGAGTWIVSGTGGAIGAAGANADVVPAGQTANQGTFGESAIDLTALGVLPGDACRTFTTSGFLTKTGNSNSAQLIDYVGFANPLTLTNCNGLSVSKLSTASNFAPATPFTYLVDQVDGRTLHDGALGGTDQNGAVLTDQDGVATSITHAIAIGDTHTWSPVQAQPDYRVSELTPLPAGWTLQSIVCSYTDLSAPAGSQAKTATIYENGAYTGQTFQVFPSSTGAPAPSCVITNAATGLVLNKVVVNDNGGAATIAGFALQATGTGPSVVINGVDPNPDPAIGISAQVAPGTYALSETALAGYAPGSWSCVDQAGAAVTTASTGPGSATVAVVAGQVVTCVLSNDDIAPTLTVTKSVQNQHGGTLLATDFPLFLNGGPVVSSVPTIVSAGVPYTATEAQQAGYLQTSIVCSDNQSGAVLAQPVVLAPGQNATCVISNTDVAPVVSIAKTVSGVDPGLAWSFQFSISPTAGVVGANPQSVAGTGNSTSATTASWSNLTGGVQYTITEVPVPGWQASLTCSGTTVVASGPGSVTFTAGIGETIVCSATNAATPASVSVSKSVTGVDASLAWSFEFSISPSAGLTGASPQTLSGIGSTTSLATASWAGLIPGATYTITEAAQPGWTTVAFSCTGVTDIDQSPASVTFVAGLAQTIVCAATNAAAPASVSVSKSVTGVDASEAWSFEFSISPSAGVTGASPQTLSGIGSTTSLATASWGGLIPGATYTITEAALAGWTPSLSCSGIADLDGNPATVTFVADPAQSVVCAAANSTTATLVVRKQVINNNGGNLGPSDFTLTVNGVSAVQGVAVTVPVGLLQAVAENPVAGYAGVGAECVSSTGRSIAPSTSAFIGVVPAPGEQLECTLINDDVPPGLTVVKQVNNIHGGELSAADFPLTVNGVGVVTSVATVPTANVDLVVSETQRAGYAALGTVCVSSIEGSSNALEVAGAGSATVNLRPGEYVTCVITNQDLPVDLALTKNDGGITAVAGGAPFHYTLTVQNVGERNVDSDEPVTVTDVLPAQFSWVTVPAACSTDGQVLTCSIDPALLPAGGAPFAIVASVVAKADTPAGTYTNVATVTTEDDPACSGEDCVPVVCPESGSQPGGNVACDDTPVTTSADLSIVKTASVTTAPGGASFAWTLLVRNAGPAAAINVAVVDEVPSPLVVTGASSETLTCVVEGNRVVCAAASLAVGGSATVLIAVSVPAGASGQTVTNTGTVTSATPDPDLANNTSSARVDIPAPLLAVTGAEVSTVAEWGAALTGAGLLLVLAATRRRV